jgi:ribosomal-protein-alanine N-acetyltransferase
MELKTRRLTLVLQSRDEVERIVAEMPAHDRAQVSADWLARLRTAAEGDPWAFAFRIVRAETAAEVGTCSFKGPPAEGVVEIAYGVHPEYEGDGYATEAAQALVDFASSRDDVSLIRAHTLPNARASKRVLTKCGFEYVGDTNDPEDGLVARFEKAVGNDR